MLDKELIKIQSGQWGSPRGGMIRGRDSWTGGSQAFVLWLCLLLLLFVWLVLIVAVTIVIESAKLTELSLHTGDINICYTNKSLNKPEIDPCFVTSAKQFDRYAFITLSHELIPVNSSIYSGFK